MGLVIRPAAFAHAAALRPAAVSAPHGRRKAPLISGRWLAVFLAFAALAWILTLAGTAFAVRLTLLLCFATLAGRARRVGVPAKARSRR